MKLQQLRYLWEVHGNALNVSATAEKLFTSQPGISKQIRLLEEELGIDLFARNGKQFTGLTPAGMQILRLSGEILSKVKDIREIANDFHKQESGMLAIATTHTQARYALPKVIQMFVRRYPGIRLTIHQGTPSQIAEQVSKGLVDLAIATEATDLFENLITMPCYQWNRSVLVPHDHPLTRTEPVTLEAVAQHPIITYTFGFTGRSQLDLAFEAAGLKPQLALTAVDADVIKTYVRLGLGIGIVAHMAYHPELDQDLVALEAAHLFAPSTTKVVVRKDAYLRHCLYEFIGMMAPHLTPDRIKAAIEQPERKALDALFRDIELPVQ